MTSYVNLKWRLGALTFVVIAALFVTFNDQIEYFYDATGLSGKTPAEVVTVKPESSKEQPVNIVPDGMRLQTNATPPWLRLYCALATSPVTIDGKPDDWTLNTGRFLCNDCASERDSHSAWMHTMFDNDNLYIFSRVRQPDGLKNNIEVKDGLKNGTFVQCRLLTDQATAINIWRDASGRGVIQLHYYMPTSYPRGIPEKKDDLFSDDDAVHRINGLAKGALIKIVEHPDRRGADIECAIPWKSLCIDPDARPRPNTFGKMSYAAQFTLGKPTHVVQFETDVRRRLYHTFFSRRAPAWPPQVEVSITDIPPGVAPEALQDQRLFKTRVNTELNQVVVDWPNPLRPDNVSASELLVTPASNPITVNGADTEWPKTAEVLIAERLSQADGAAKLKASADDENLYIHANIYDVTPNGYGNALVLKLKTDSIRELTIKMKSVSINGADVMADGAKVATLIPLSHLEYSLEAAIPWKLLTSDGKKPESFPITGYAALNPYWKTASLTGDVPVTDNDGNEEGWISAMVIDNAPDQPGPIVFANRLVYDLGAGIPEQISYFQGKTLRFPQGTWNPAIDVLPGTPSVDGGIDDWDLSGGIFLCPDLHLYRDNNAVWVHAMYDSEHLYILYRFIDSTPMSNTSTERYYHDDMAEFILSGGGPTFTWAVAAMEGGGDLYSAVYLGASRESNTGLANSIKTAYSKDPDGNGYCIEASIPWATLGGRKVSGDVEPIYFTARTTPRMIMSDPSKFSSVVAMPEKPELYGIANFLDKGPITPRPCNLANGKQVPVVMRDGKPELDLSQLK